MRVISRPRRPIRQVAGRFKPAQTAAKIGRKSQAFVT
jgi:hypothetical protein